MSKKVEVYYHEPHHGFGDWFVEIWASGKRFTNRRCDYCEGIGFFVDKDGYKIKCLSCGGRKKIPCPSLQSFQAERKYCREFVRVICQIEDYEIMKEIDVPD